MHPVEIVSKPENFPSGFQMLEGISRKISQNILRNLENREVDSAGLFATGIDVRAQGTDFSSKIRRRFGRGICEWIRRVRRFAEIFAREVEFVRASKKQGNSWSESMSFFANSGGRQEIFSKSPVARPRFDLTFG